MQGEAAAGLEHGFMAPRINITQAFKICFERKSYL